MYLIWDCFETSLYLEIIFASVFMRREYRPNTFKIFWNWKNRLVRNLLYYFLWFQCLFFRGLTNFPVEERWNNASVCQCQKKMVMILAPWWLVLPGEWFLWGRDWRTSWRKMMSLSRNFGKGNWFRWRYVYGMTNINVVHHEMIEGMNWPSWLCEVLKNGQLT